MTLSLFEHRVEDEADYQRMPSTRYLGSKRKLLPALHAVFKELEFDVAMDPFCGSGAVAYLLKCMGKTVMAQDAQRWNVVCTRALLSHPVGELVPKLRSAFDAVRGSTAGAGFIERHFENLFFTTEENRFLDRFLGVISDWPQPEKDAAWYALFQAALAKRPYNLFHRANLYMRLNDVKRSFGNKATWDTSFETLILKNAAELVAAQFESANGCAVRQQRVEDVEFSTVQLVYLDPPYISARGAGVDYLDYYHFLEGICLEDEGAWERRMLSRYKHRPLEGRGENAWCKPGEILAQFAQVLARCQHATVVISYRSDGIPTIDDLTNALEASGKTVTQLDCGTYVYALSKNNRSKEMILIGE